MSVILYDIPSNGRCHSWSPNTWKTRGALNLKGIDYKTEWTEYPDIAPKLKSFGLAPNERESALYTCPAVRFSDGSILMQSRKIADELEKRFPNTPSLHLDAPIFQEAEAAVGKTHGALYTELIPKVPAILNPPSTEYFLRTRAERFGMPLAEVEKEKGGENAWKAAEAPIKELAELLKRNEAGPFFLGETPSYADVLCLGMLEFSKAVGHGIFDRLLKQDEAFAALYQAGQPFLQRDDR